MGLNDDSVLAGDYKSKLIMATMKSELYIAAGFKTRVFLNKDTIKKYEVVGTEEKTNKKSALGRGVVGGVLFGGAGTAVGLMSGKKNSLTKIAIDFKDGNRSLIQLGKRYYKIFEEKMF